MNSNVRCLKCHALLAADDGELAAAFDAADRQPGEPRFPVFSGTISRLRRWNPFRQFWSLPEDSRYRFPYTAGLLSLFPGAGQFYNRQPGKAVLLAGLWWGWLMISIFTVRAPFSNLLLLILLLGWLLIWNDAIAAAVRINGEIWSFRNSVALFFAAMFATGVLITGSQLFGANLVSLVRVLDSSQEPDLRVGDIVLTNYLAYWFSSPALGDVIYFDPGRFTAENNQMFPPVTASINVKDFYQRIAGLPGDTIEKRDGSIYRNGRIMAAGEEPFTAAIIPEGESFRVPPDHYWAPVTGVPSDALATLIGVGSPGLFQRGWIYQGWREAGLVRKEEIYGRAVAVMNPPERRRWLSRQP